LFRIVRAISQDFLKIGKDRGVIGFIEHVKSVRLSYYLYLSGEHLTKKVPGVLTTREGFPIILKPWIDFSKELHISDPVFVTGLRLVNTLLSSTRALSKGKKPDLDSIMTPPIVVTHYEGKADFDFWRILGLRPSTEPRVPKVLNFRNFHFSSKSGPNGPALGSSIADLNLISLNKRLLDSICIVGGPKLEHRIRGLVDQLEFVTSGHPRFPQHRLRKLSVVPDKELKLRIVAVLDY